ncbi:hypothetical protein NLU13_0871 [Sarocladium strictum]|uniref:Cupin type-2 domain-containing protein n=1 Tax=Sarocladium strictum TaxID=5046 RepID=A0AA39LBU2_SARSR|nr:hypothetical protein NLU13_0871 [Sarocladium strictum]
MYIVARSFFEAISYHRDPLDPKVREYSVPHPEKLSATTATQAAEPGDLPRNHRYITTHNKDGKAIYVEEVSTPLDFWDISTADGKSARFELAYTTHGFPVQMNKDEDLSSFKEDYAKRQESGIVKQGGTLLRYVDLHPNDTTPMHRTSSLDYGILISGSLECLLDSGESRTIYPGDVLVQRGTNHQWNNNTDKWVRILFVVTDAAPLDVNGARLEEDINGILVPESH